MISAAYGQDLVRLPLALRHSRRAGNLLLPAYAFQVIRQNPVRAPLTLRHTKGMATRLRAHMRSKPYGKTLYGRPTTPRRKGHYVLRHICVAAQIYKKGTCGKFRKSLCRPFML